MGTAVSRELSQVGQPFLAVRLPSQQCKLNTSLTTLTTAVSPPPYLLYLLYPLLLPLPPEFHRLNSLYGSCPRPGPRFANPRRGNRYSRRPNFLRCPSPLPPGPSPRGHHPPRRAHHLLLPYRLLPGHQRRPLLNPLAVLPSPPLIILIPSVDNQRLCLYVPHSTGFKFTIDKYKLLWHYHLWKRSALQLNRLTPLDSTLTAPSKFALFWCK